MRASLSTCSTRTLTAVDSAVMVLDASKRIEEQTGKLF
jgi:peptide subunit release factor RF-3